MDTNFVGDEVSCTDMYFDIPFQLAKKSAADDFEHMWQILLKISDWKYYWIKFQALWQKEKLLMLAITLFATNKIKSLLQIYQNVSTCEKAISLHECQDQVDFVEL